MNIFKHIFIITAFMTSCSALGMFVPNKQSIVRKEAHLNVLGLQYLSEKEQPKFFELLSKNDLRTKAENHELLGMARYASKYRRGLRKQEQQRAILKSSDPNRRRTL